MNQAKFGPASTFLAQAGGRRGISLAICAFALYLLTGLVPTSWAEETPAAAPAAVAPAQAALDMMSDPKVIANTLWVLITAMLVFWMNAGFACVETGLCRRKNAVNILSKNFIVFAVSTVAFWFVGFGLMFGNGNAFLGTTGFFPSLVPGEGDLSPLTGTAYSGSFNSLNWTATPLGAKFFFQLVFAGTAATIVSGVVAERIKYHSFIIFSFILVGIIYVIPGHWIWGGGWLSSMADGQKAFFDFAGSTVVHSCGGWAGLAGAIVLGSRLGKYRAGGGVNPIPGHNMGLAALGCLILWLGWFGFNPGSTMTADPGAISHIALTTNMAAATGAIAATLTAWALFKKPDLSMTLNGCLAGLVAITAPCAFVTVGGSFVIGCIAGTIVVFAIVFFDKLKIDDPVGALSVHLVNGIFGTIAVGLFASPSVPSMAGQMNAVPGSHPAAGLFYGGGPSQLIVQLIGIAACAAYVFPVSVVAWLILKAVIGIRVSAEEEIEGLDLGEHGMEAYPGFAKEEGRDTYGGAVTAEALARSGMEIAPKELSQKH